MIEREWRVWVHVGARGDRKGVSAVIQTVSQRLTGGEWRVWVHVGARGDRKGVSAVIQTVRLFTVSAVMLVRTVRLFTMSAVDAPKLCPRMVTASPPRVLKVDTDGDTDDIDGAMYPDDDWPLNAADERTPQASKARRHKPATIQ